MRHALGVLVCCLGAALAAGACGGGGPSLGSDELMDPQKCQKCHPDHFREWSGSMHAYAADDPVFLAMNARAQREAKVGDFCVKCHAPMAVRTGATRDGLNLKDLPAHLRGVTCYFCHSAESVTGTHDAPITLATDGVLRAGITDPVENTAHKAAHSPLLDRAQPESAKLCGSCHDIVNGQGTHLERTFEEWQGTLFSHAPLGLTCGQCHMEGRDGLAAQAPDVALRRVHSHMFPGVDLALTAFPEADAQKEAVQAALDPTLQTALCVKGAPGAATIQVVLDNVGAGHQWPSGATQDRRAWVEVIAYDASDQVLYQSGVVPAGQPVTGLQDPDLWLIRDCIFDGQGNEVHMFWEAASHDSNQLPGPVTSVQTDPAYYLTHVTQSYPRPTSSPPLLAVMPARVTMRVLLTPIGLDVLENLVKSKDLDAAVPQQMTTFSLGGAALEWTEASATIKYVEAGLPVTCVSRGLSGGASSANPAPVHTKCQP
jgi:hypothetical protein